MDAAKPLTFDFSKSKGIFSFNSEFFNAIYQKYVYSNNNYYPKYSWQNGSPYTQDPYEYIGAAGEFNFDNYVLKGSFENPSKVNQYYLVSQPVGSWGWDYKIFTTTYDGQLGYDTDSHSFTGVSKNTVFDSGNGDIYLSITGDLDLSKVGIRGIGTGGAAEFDYLTSGGDVYYLSSGINLDCGAGEDTIYAGTSNSSYCSVTGGKGNDYYIIDSNDRLAIITERSDEGIDTIQSTVNYTLGANIESLILSGSSAINGTGNSSANTLIGNSSNNTLDGATGVDSMAGGLGNDTYVVDNERDAVTENVSAGIDAVLSSANFTLGANVENLFLIGSGTTNGIGNGLANQITGNAAANYISAGAGNDTLLGGGGNDTLNPGVGVDTVSGGSGSDLLQIDWSGLSGLTITRSIALDRTEGASGYKGSYIAKNTSGSIISSVAFDGIESLLFNGYLVDLNAATTPGITIKRNSSATATTEQGGVVQYSVVLNKAPIENVSIAFTSSDTTEGKVTTPSLTFTPQNWNSPQVLSIQGVDDYLDDGNVAFSVNGKIITQDLTYGRIEIPVINLINKDDGQDTPLNLQGTSGIDYLTGKNGDDRIYGGGNQDELRGGRGNDRIYGEQDDDRLFGEEGNDKLYGGYDDDKLDGGNGSDSLFGEQGLDTLLGGNGNDYLDGGIEADSMVGGAGNDTYLVDSTGDVINDLGATTDVDTVIITQTISYTLGANIENASVNSTAGNGNLTGNTLGNGLTGNDAKNILDGGSGNDTLDGGAGSDSLLGGIGSDVIDGGAGNDTMRGGDGVDVADFAAAGLDISIDLTTGKATGEGTDLLFDIENVLSGEGNDKLSGSSADNNLDGGAGTDSLNGGAGNDTMAGCFYGANGGQGEVDTLTGGAGADLFQLGWSGGCFYNDGIRSNAGRSDYALITDFTVGTDRLQLDGVASNYYLGASGVTGVSGLGLWLEQGATDELVAIIRSANSTTFTADNLIKTAAFV